MDTRENGFLAIYIFDLLQDFIRKTHFISTEIR